MAVSRAMRRLLHVLEIQEEECRAAMESARVELKRLEQALTRSVERERGGRRLVAASAATGEITDRIAGIEETRVAKRIATALTPRIAESESAVNLRQREFLGKRIERRQTETLIEQTEKREAIEEGRRGQQRLDGWYSSRLYKKRGETEPPATAAEPNGAPAEASKPSIKEDLSAKLRKT